MGLEYVLYREGESKMKARKVILEAVDLITYDRSNRQFEIGEVLKVFKSNGTIYKESTIRTHIVSRCCANSPNHQESVYKDFERVGKGIYVWKESGNV